MFDLSPLKILVIVAVALLLLGPDKLPEVARKLGSSWRALKRLQERVEAEVREAVPDLPSTSDIVRIARNPVNVLNQLADRAEAREEPRRVAPVPATPANEPPTAPTGANPPSTVDTPPLPAPPSRSDFGSPPADPSLN